MSFDGTIHLLGPRARTSAQHQHQHESQFAQLQRVAPATFRLDLGTGHHADAPLRLLGGGGGAGYTGHTGHAGHAGSGRAPRAASLAGAGSDCEHVTLRIERRLARLLFVSQVLIVLILGFMIFSLLFFAYRVQSNANWAYVAAQPYIYEFSNHSMEIMRHAHNSSEQLEAVMIDGRELSSNAVPALTQSLNSTVAMVGRMQQIAANPVVKLSLGSV